MTWFAQLLLLLVEIVVQCDGVYKYGSPLCTDDQFPEDIAKGEREVELRYCPLTGVPPGALDHLTAVEKFTMAHMSSLHEFPNVTALAHTLGFLFLWDNAISYVNPAFLGALTVLHTLSLTSNQLTSLPDVPSLISLKNLYLIANDFEAVPCLVNCRSLGELNLKDNRIATVPAQNLVNLTSMYQLNLESAHLTELPDLVHIPTLKILHLGGGSLQTVASHRTAVLGNLWELKLTGAPDLRHLPTLCPKTPSALSVTLGGTGLRLCDCEHAWLKAAEEAGTTVNLPVTPTLCGGQDWHNLTTAAFLRVCDVIPRSKRALTVTQRATPLFCAFPRRPVLSDTTLTACILLCADTPGCLSFNFRPGGGVESVGDCVLLTPAEGGGGGGSVVEESQGGWMLYGLHMMD